MTMSITGNKKDPQRAFTLIEVMVAVAVLSFGLVMVYQAFFIVLDTFNYGADYLEVSPWINEKIWQAQDSIMNKGALADTAPEGEFILQNKKFTWSLKSSAISEVNDLTAFDLEVSWKEGKRAVQVSRNGYARYHEE
jgi:prepilin-type N-terminal cleavage/methylation domain-containing protein